MSLWRIQKKNRTPTYTIPVSLFSCFCSTILPTVKCFLAIKLKAVCDTEALDLFDDDDSIFELFDVEAPQQLRVMIFAVKFPNRLVKTNIQDPTYSLPKNTCIENEKRKRSKRDNKQHIQFDYINKKSTSSWSVGQRHL